MSGLARVEVVEPAGTTRPGGTRVVRVVGEIDLSNVVEVIDEVSAALPDDAARVVLDLTSTAYVDSAAVAGLFRLVERIAHRRQELRFVVPVDNPIRRVVELTGLDQVVTVLDGLDEHPSS